MKINDSSIKYLFCWLHINTIHSLNVNPTKGSNRLKQFVRKLPTNCLSVFDHFGGLALKVLTSADSEPFRDVLKSSYYGYIDKNFEKYLQRNSYFIKIPGSLPITLLKLAPFYLFFNDINYILSKFSIRKEAVICQCRYHWLLP